MTASSPVAFLPGTTSSLARGIPQAAPGTLHVLGDRGGIRVAPTPRFTVVFGRNEPDVHVCIGGDDPRVSRQQGMFSWGHTGWTVRNTGGVPIRLPGSQLLLTGHEQPIGPDYTPMFIRTAPGREHLLEVRVSDQTPPHRTAAATDRTERPELWALTERERLVLVVLGQRYLRHEAHPQPLSWGNVAQELHACRPEEGWTTKRAEWTVAGVRKRLVGAGVPGLTRDEVGEPIGNTINHNLLLELLISTTIVPPDLRLCR